MSLNRLHIEAQDPAFFRLRRVVFVAWLIWGILSLVLVALLGALGLAFALIFAVALILWLQLRVYHKGQVEQFHHYRQIEAYFSLFSSLKIMHPLPPMRLWVISPDFAVLILSVIRQHRPRLIVELGSGVSTLICGYSLEDSGRVVSFEHIAEYAQHTRDNLARHGLAQRAEVIHAPLKPRGNGMWYDVSAFDAVAEIDLLIIDGPPEDTGYMARLPALPALWDKLSDGALILIDDAMRDNAIIEHWLGEFACELIAFYPNEKGATLLQKRG